ncbi:MAG: hypothetical protein ACRDBO_10695 [Lachnospiraceae bacterium]
MKKELNYFYIDEAYGSNQDWFPNFLMHMGGCAAVTACDSCIYLARTFDMTHLYPDDPENITKEDFVSFGMKMKPYLKPRMKGVNKLSLYEDGFGRYLADRHSPVTLHGFAGDNPLKAAADFIKTQIDKELLIPYLLLKHQSPALKDFVWHWFVLTGYEQTADDFYVDIATYGKRFTFSLKQLWDTGYEEKGGMIEIHLAI